MSTEPKIERIAHYYHDVDNGGPCVTINRITVEESNGDSFSLHELVLESSYYGYASVSAKLAGAQINAEFLRNVGTMLIEAAAKIK